MARYPQTINRLICNTSEPYQRSHRVVLILQQHTQSSCHTRLVQHDQSDLERDLQPGALDSFSLFAGRSDRSGLAIATNEPRLIMIGLACATIALLIIILVH